MVNNNQVNSGLRGQPQAQYRGFRNGNQQMPGYGQQVQHGFGAFQGQAGQVVAGNNGVQNLDQGQMLNMNRQYPQMQTSPPMQTEAPPQGPVTYEAPDEKTMAKIKELIAKKQDELGVPLEERKLPNELMLPGTPQIVSAESDVTFHKNAAMLKLAEFIQGERNAGLFYKGLLGLMENNYAKNKLNEIVSNTNIRKSLLSKAYITMASEEYSEKDSDIITPRNIKAALEDALEIESGFLKQISEFYDDVEHEGSSKIINSVIHKKLMDINSLQQLMYKM